MTHDFACRYEKIRAFAEKFLADGGLSPVISKKYIIVPGLCDVHVHFREPGFSYKETISFRLCSPRRTEDTRRCLHDAEPRPRAGQRGTSCKSSWK